MKNNNSKPILILIYTLIWAISVAIGLYFRFYPLTSYTSSDSYEKASILVIANLKNKIVNRVEQNYPTLSKSQKDLIVKKQFDLSISKEKDKVRKLIKDVSLKIESSNPKKNKTPYLLASDSFYYYDLTQNINKTGKISERIKGSKYLNDKMLAPKGHWEPLNLHPFIGYYIYKFLKLFVKDISLMQAVSFVPIVITALSLIPFLYICFNFSLNPIYSFIASIFFLLSPIFVKRSSFGWYDNDPYNILFPLLIIASIFHFFNIVWEIPKHAKNRLKYLIAPAIISSILILLYSLFWQGWMFIFSIIFISGLITIIYLNFILKDKSQSKNNIIYYLTLLIATFTLISFILGIQEFFILFSEGIVALKNFITPQLSPWPDLYISVGELHSTSINHIINVTGGYLFFIISVFGLFYHLTAILKKLRNKAKSNTTTSNVFISKLILIVVFLLLSLFISLGAQRFAIFVLIPLALGFPLGLNIAVKYLNNFVAKKFKLNEKKSIVLKTSVFFLLIFIIFLPIKKINKSIGSLLNQIYNATWEEALEEIQVLTPPDSIINTWWPPGHFIKAIADRKVTFDGATINFPQAYWISNFFLSQSEKEGLGILRMLNCSANNAAEYLQKLGLNLPSTIEILKIITRLNEKDARTVLSRAFKDESQINKLLELTHNTPPPSYCLIYNEFIENNLQLSFIGNWNFKKIEEINNNQELLKSVPNRNSKDYISFLWELAGGPHRYSGALTEISRKNDTITFQNNVFINSKTHECLINSQEYGKGIPYSIFYLKENEVIEQKLKNSNLSYSVILIEKPNKSECVLLDNRIAKSLLVKLYFYDGKGLKYFKPIIHKSDLTKRTDIKVFEIDWNSFIADLKRNK